MPRMRRLSAGGFSRIEAAIVVVVLGVVAAFAIPRLGRGAAAPVDADLAASLAALRNAIDLYAAEHDTKYPAATLIAEQLTRYTNDAGEPRETNRDRKHPYGPYLRAIPPLPVGTRKGQAGISLDGQGADAGWVYHAASGKIEPNTGSEMDPVGRRYCQY